MSRGKTSVGFMVFAILMAFGCATQSLTSQSFVEVRSLHFDLVSSLDDARTRELVRDLEFFHAGALSLLGVDATPEGHARTRVLAFDDRSLDRPFSVRGTAAYYLPGVDEGVLVLRVPDGWQERTARPVRAAYAHRLVRSRSTERLPLWVEEGLAQVASAIQIRDGEIRMGALIEDYVTEVADWRRSSLAPILQETDLSEASNAERGRFEALSWGLTHALMFPAPGAVARRSFPQAYLAAFDAAVGGDGRRAADAQLGGDGADLAELVHSHLEQPRFAMRVIRPLGWDPRALDLRPMSAGRSNVALGDLALDLDRSKLAARFFDRALREDPEDADALSGLALARVARFEESESLAQQAVRQAPDAVDVQIRVGRFYAIGAGLTQDEKERSRRIDASRRALRASVELDATRALPRVELARSHLGEGQDPAEGIKWLQSAAPLRPGALEIDLVRARLERARGHRRAAAFQAREVASRSQWEPLRDEARELLAELDSEP